jgi:hypothetical protein
VSDAWGGPGGSVPKPPPVRHPGLGPEPAPGEAEPVSPGALADSLRQQAQRAFGERSVVLALLAIEARLASLESTIRRTSR